MAEEFNEEFGGENDKAVASTGAPDSGIVRVRTPKGKEIIGIVDQLLGFRKMYVRCSDSKTRLCRVPGRFRRSMWVRQGDVVLVEPWELGGDERGDILIKYSQAQVDFLRRKGFMKAEL